ncbi:ABC transporter substrate-binding protein [Streptomyces europaeiscabiei]|uniref:ABC transporter substrate-binding protein n=1 Tax=Streptomyces europaeiscabiei TaxID=146819 RepID=A0ABU4NIU6_9ACTN|nr:ABC transporter substrate-binding protein [Streptomyces europaeiscabiei]MDX2524414.1 ABC transporter substrate-binding protein [Streptomyces europaeiscabiei]MDX3545679.1 ABC transporter substrate-binding protein [Streptomyces europaeiscabiei]MDX3554923.1 ABC transporter substrate-binding protein [Streptomyces europaeiscabiei]MDX3670881.1 ABC transporter substrate-binding protein [Streptomyces europaeiscabiei]MDX3702810.1 ABC transporter substrate-binding protein [Streptomyces europaeiscabie
MDLTRRQLLWAGGAIGAGVMLTACGGDDEAPTGSATGDPATPRKGGTLRVGALGRAGAITRDPHGSQANESDYLIISLLYDTLTIPGTKPNTEPRLAASWKPSEDLKTWRFTLAKGAKFHDGTPVTAEDVVFSLKRLRATPSGASRLPGIQEKNITAEGTDTVVIVSDYANAELPLLVRLTTFVIPKGTTDKDMAKAPGTGPFKLDWFRGGNARLVRNDDWYGGEVHLDAIEVKIFESPQAMASALLAGQIDLASNVGAVAARTAESRKDIQAVRRPNDMAMPIVMRTADGPFADPGVREALRLAVDREAMVKQVLSGYGTVANDVLGTGDPAYDKSLPQRTRDLTKAKALLKEAKFDTSKTYELYTTEDISGLAESATLFATQVREAGVKVKVVKQESATFWDKTWLKGDLYTTYWGTNDSVVFFASKTMVSDSGTNESGWKNDDFDAAYEKAIGTPDASERTRLLKELQKIEYDSSGYLLWGMADGIDLAGAKVRGLPTLPGYGRVQLEGAWLAS